MKTILLSFLVYIFFTGTLSGQAVNERDLQFGNNGRTFLQLHQYASSNAVAIQADGKIVSGGWSFDSLYLVRYLTDGNRDNTFGSNGVMAEPTGGVSAQICDIAIQADGKIVIAIFQQSEANFLLLRYNSNGSIDLTFGNGGIVSTNFGNHSAYTTRLAIQADGKIVVAGTVFSSLSTEVYYGLVRYTSQGVADSTFNGNGELLTQMGVTNSTRCNGLAIQTDGKILAAGSTETGGAVVRYLPNGQRDVTFDSDGIVNVTDLQVNCIKLQQNNKIVIGGESGLQFGVRRIESNGSMDNTFGSSGLAVTALGSDFDRMLAMDIAPDDRIVCGGAVHWNSSGQKGVLACLNSNGSIDSSFSADGLFIDSLSWNLSAVADLAIQTDGKIVTTGTTDFAGAYYLYVDRYNKGISLGLSDVLLFDNASVYPNPVTATFTSQYTTTQNILADIILTDVAGRKIKELLTSQMRNPGQHTEKFDIQEFPNGVYFVQLHSGNHTKTIQLIKE